MPSIQTLLQTRHEEHQALLKRIVTILQADPRVVAAWLFGSRGRGNSDDFSDLDLWVIVQDEHIEAISADRQSYVARASQPVLLLEAPGNAPTRGAYLMALYPGQAGAHQVDWYWQRQSDASLPRRAVLLFDRVGIPQDERLEQLDPHGPPRSLSQEERAREATQLSSYFWAMSNIAVKGILRRYVWSAVSTIEMLRGLVDDMQRLLGESTTPKYKEEWRVTVTPPVQPRDQLIMLREIARSMERLTPSIQAIGGHVQSAFIPYVYDFIDLAEAMIGQAQG